MATNRHVVVTGASGLVGSGVIEALQEANFEVVGLSRRNAARAFENIPWIECDLRDSFEGELDRYLPIHGLVHLGAAISAPAEFELQTFRTVNMSATERLFEYCGIHGIEKVIFTSSLGMMARPLLTPITESHAIAPLLPYHVSKYWGELALQFAARRYPIIGLILRISSPVGKRLELLPPTVVRKWLTLAAQGGPIGLWGRGSRTQDFVSVEDIGAAVVQGLERAETSDLINIGSGRQTSMQELARAISSLSGVTVEVANAVDPNENERWEVDLTHAKSVLRYAPRFSILDYLPTLWEQVTCGVH